MTAFSIAMLAALIVACGPAEAPDPSAASDASELAKPTSSDPPAQAQASPSPPAPEPALAKTVEPDPARGDAVYQTYCASCHGARGRGDGPVGQVLDPKPARHNDGAYMNPLSNDYLFQVIAEGGAAVGKSPLMAPWGGTLTDAQIWDVVAFLRTLAEPPYEGATP